MLITTSTDSKITDTGIVSKCVRNYSTLEQEQDSVPPLNDGFELEPQLSSVIAVHQEYNFSLICSEYNCMEGVLKKDILGLLHSNQIIEPQTTVSKSSGRPLMSACEKQTRRFGNSGYSSVNH